MKLSFTLFLTACLLITLNVFSQENKTSLYNEAMKQYEGKNYKAAAKVFDNIFSYRLSNKRLYDAACIYALNQQNKRALDILAYLAGKQFYSNYDHIVKDSDLTGLHHHKRWPVIVNKVKDNKASASQRLPGRIATALHNAKQRLQADNGQLWGQLIWNENMLVLDYDNTVYSITEFPGSKTDSGKIYYAKLPPNTLTFVNTVQTYAGKDYAIVLSNYLSDHSSTIIHELFHLLQRKARKLNGDAIKYLDNYEARELLRLEYQALRNALYYAGHKSAQQKVVACLEDALRFRKIRQGRNKDYLQPELEIETLEGLANYTGFALSGTPDKYEEAIEEIYQREEAQTYTRPFPYATGVAYGLLFDHLHIQWKAGLDQVYNFLAIYEKAKATAIDTTVNQLARARKSNNFEQIHREEEDRRTQNEKLLAYYRSLLQEKPTLRAQITDGMEYNRTFNMNGTIEIPGLGTVYSGIQGRDKSGKCFGSFKTIEDKSVLGNAGVLMLPDYKTFIFPTPFRMEGNKIIGDTYEIELNEGWSAEKADDTGNYVIRKKNNP
ncbi:hypothetical protein HB364_15185 [Pseudoflavitalea sp. X16]|uniref:hypothetical protein n=1 Tax=Paraflavitalea devenefica TaxID=2716334 RepID=UPI00141F6867|nr:hypothetical protein [Paraflavitalea devenefica]NII26432.1 hypothetical protein [Paraflavitalea devenefica]